MKKGMEISNMNKKIDLIQGEDLTLVTGGMSKITAMILGAIVGLGIASITAALTTLAIVAPTQIIAKRKFFPDLRMRALTEGIVTNIEEDLKLKVSMNTEKLTQEGSKLVWTAYSEEAKENFYKDFSKYYVAEMCAKFAAGVVGLGIEIGCIVAGVKIGEHLWKKANKTQK